MLNMPLSPCCPYYPAGVDRRLSQSATIHAAFTPNERARPPALFFFEATCGFTCVFGGRQRCRSENRPFDVPHATSLPDCLVRAHLSARWSA